MSRGSRAAGAVVVAVAAAALLGYAFDVQEFRGFGRPVEMKPNAAVGLALAGLALILATTRTRAAAALSAMLGAVVAAIGAATLAEHLFVFDLRIDELLFDDRSSVATVSPGRMGPPAALNLLAAGIALVLLQLRGPRARAASQTIALASAPVPLLGVVGYAYGVGLLYAVPTITAVALHSAIALLVLDLGILFARPDGGFVANLASVGSGSALARRMLVYVLAIPFALGWIALRLAHADAGGALAVSLLVVGLALVLVVLVFRDALALDRMEVAKERAQADRAASREELARALRREQDAREHAESANRAKDEFLATLSHELRTPLNAILGWNRVLRDGPPDAERLGRGLGVIERNGRALTQLVSDLLDMSRIATGDIQVDRVELDVVPVVEAAVEAMLPIAEAKGVAVSCALDPDAPRVQGDGVRLQQVAWNLLSNAVKFTPPGGRVDVQLAGEGGEVVLEVVDNGVGIAAEFLPLVFERFTQADGSAARRHGGLGLGLAISRQLVALHGGTIEAASAGPGQGATFRVRLPASVVPDAREVLAPRRDRSALRGARFVVVDDEADSRELLLQLLQSWGARATGAASAREALDALARESPDAVVSDIAMPGEDGFALVAALRRAEQAEGRVRLPAAALTAFARADDRRRVLAAGFDAHLAKPVEPDELYDTLVALVRRVPAHVVPRPAGADDARVMR